jgi:hypothetical protein
MFWYRKSGAIDGHMIKSCLRERKCVRNLTRREVLKAESTGVVTAMFNPLLGNAESEKEDNSVRKPDLVQAPDEEICFMEATTLVELLRTKKVSSVEVMKAHLSQISRVNSKVNAIVTLVEEEQLLAKARAADDALAKGTRRHVLISS